jgi:hypothetical protein
MNLTPDDPRLVELLINEMKEDGLFDDFENLEDLEIETSLYESTIE